MFLELLESQLNILINVDKENYRQLRKMLFRRGLSFQEFIGGIIRLASSNDPRTKVFFDEALAFKLELLRIQKEQKNNKLVEIPANKKTTTNQIYNIIENESPFK